jgi:hypothetical protein
VLLNKFQHTTLPDSSAETTKFGSNFDQSMALTFVPSCEAKDKVLLLPGTMGYGVDGWQR